MILILAASLFTSCRKETQPAEIFVPINENFQNPQHEETAADTEIICPIGIEAYTDLKAWNEYLVESLKPESCISKNISQGTYKVYVQFTIEMDGKISDVTALNDPGYGLGQKASAAIRNYKGKWYPAEESGHYCSSYRVQPVTFVVDK